MGHRQGYTYLVEGPWSLVTTYQSKIFDELALLNGKQIKRQYSDKLQHYIDEKGRLQLKGLSYEIHGYFIGWFLNLRCARMR